MVIAKGLVFQFYRLPKIPTDYMLISNTRLKYKTFFRDIENLQLADKNYRLYKKEDVMTVLKLHRFSELEYIKEIRDCDDYSWSLVSHLKKLLPGICAGMIWVDVLKRDMTLDYKHSLVVWVDYDGNHYYIEPQSNRIFSAHKYLKPTFAVI